MTQPQFAARTMRAGIDMNFPIEASENLLADMRKALDKVAA